MEESLAEKYLIRLKEESNSAKILLDFYNELFNLPFNVELLKSLNRAVKLYGSMAVYFSILEIYGMENVDHSNVIRLIFYFCKKHLEEKDIRIIQEINTEGFDKLVERIKKTKLEIRNPFDD